MNSNSCKVTKFCRSLKIKMQQIHWQLPILLFFGYYNFFLDFTGVNDQYLSLADIIVATPGRLVDHIQKTEGFTLNHLRYLVIDEADRVMEDVQNDWLVFTFFCFSWKWLTFQILCCFRLSHVERSVYTGDREKLTAINCANAMKMQTPLQKLLFR